MSANDSGVKSKSKFPKTHPIDASSSESEGVSPRFFFSPFSTSSFVFRHASKSHTRGSAGMATFPAITGIAAYVIAGFTPHVISNNASFNCAFSSANVCACARACSKCISKYAHFARISRSISRLRARDAADASRFAARRFARLCGAPIVDVIGANTPHTRPRHRTRPGARARNESTSNARHVALDRALDGGNDTERAFSSSSALGRPRSVVRARASGADTARARPRARR